MYAGVCVSLSACVRFCVCARACRAASPHRPTTHTTASTPIHGQTRYLPWLNAPQYALCSAHQEAHVVDVSEESLLLLGHVPTSCARFAQSSASCVLQSDGACQEGGSQQGRPRRGNDPQKGAVVESWCL